MFLPGLERFATPADMGLPELERHLPRAAFFDIETDGLGASARVTLIACLLDGQLEVFARDENLDAFLTRIEAAEVLVSFNGGTFDEPKLLQHFSLPQLPRPHLDLRPLCRTQGLTGGLKKIERQLGLQRPPDISGLTGEDADWMWRAWIQERDAALRLRLLRYCAADVIALRWLAGHLLGQALPAEPWAALDQLATVPPPPVPAPAEATAPAVAPPPAVTADPVYDRLRAHHRRQRKQFPI